MRKTFISFLLALCMVFSLAVVSTGALAATEPETGYSDEVIAATQLAIDRIEVENVIDMHEYYHSALNHMGEFLEIWVNEDPWMETMSWTNNTQKMVGAYNLYGFMVTDLVSNITNSLSSAQANDAQGIITDDASWYGTGMFWYHMLMSPVIEVAGDGQTARACFQSFGTVTGPMGEMSSQWTCESYGFDCAKMSTGEWKIWHLHTYVYFYCDTDEHWYDISSNTAASGAGSANAPVGVGVMYDADGNQLTGQTYLNGDDTDETETAASGEIPADMTPPNGDMTPPNGDMTPPSSADASAAASAGTASADKSSGTPSGSASGDKASGMPSGSASGDKASGMPSGEKPDGMPGGGGYSQGDYEILSGTYFTGYSIYKTAESVPMPYAYETWADVEANGDGY